MYSSLSVACKFYTNPHRENFKGNFNFKTQKKQIFFHLDLKLFINVLISFYSIKSIHLYKNWFALIRYTKTLNLHIFGTNEFSSNFRL